MTSAVASSARKRAEAASPVGTAASHTWAIGYLDSEGASLGSTAVQPDWAPLIECAQFAAMRLGLIEPVLGVYSGHIVPLWHAEHGAPRVRAVRAIVGCDEADEPRHHVDVPANAPFFDALARAGSEALVARGALTEGQTYAYRVDAFPIDGRRASAPFDDGAEGIVFEEIDEPLELREQPIESLASLARAAGRGAREEDMRVFVPAAVVEEVVARAHAAGDLEIGGMLIGHLRSSPGSPEIYAEVTAQVPARHTDATRASLTFTAESWTAFEAAIALRGAGERPLAWWHSHPDFGTNACARCPEERRRRCPLSRPFFSSTDVHLHATCFPRAWQTALLVSDLGSEPRDVSFFGWRDGAVVSRGFEIVERPIGDTANERSEQEERGEDGGHGSPQ